MADVKINSLIKIQTLCLLDQGPKHGYEIIKELENVLSRNISASHVYPFLKNLESNGFIAFRKIETRDKKKYYLTNDGNNFVTKMFDKIGPVFFHVIERSGMTCPNCNTKVESESYKKKIEAII